MAARENDQDSATPKDESDRSPRRSFLEGASALAVAAGCAGALLAPATALALDGGPLRVTPRNGWKAFEVISVGNDVPGDGFAYASPGTYDGVGAWLSDASNLRPVG